MRKAEIVVRLTLDAEEVASVDRQVAEGEHATRVAWVRSLVKEAIFDELKEFKEFKQRRSV